MRITGAQGTRVIGSKVGRQRGSIWGGSSSRGGAAMEYVVVTAFALVSAAAAVGLAAKAIKGKMAAISESLGLEDGELGSEIDAFLDEEP